MSEFFHGVRTIKKSSSPNQPVVATSGITFAVGTAPVHITDNPSVDEPVLIQSFPESERLLGFADDWQKYDLCEIVYSHFKLYNTSPVVFVNVLDPKVHKKTVAPKAYPITNGRAVLPFEAVKSTVKAESYVKGEDFELFYNDGQLIFEVIEGGGIASTVTEVSVGFDEVDPSMVTAEDIIGGLDLETKKRKGLELINAVFPKYRILPDICLCPKWSGKPEVAAVMAAKMEGYNGIFNGKALIDVDTNAVKFYQDVPAWKAENGINSKTQVLCFPLVRRDGRTFRMSTHMAGLMATVDASNSGIPSESPSNKPLIIDSVVVLDESDAEGAAEILLDIQEANYLNENGITTAVNFANGFVLWGNYTAIYPNSDNPNNPDEYFLYASRMFDWVGNTVILTHWARVDGKLNQRIIESIVDVLNIWFNGLVREEHLLGGRAEFPPELNSAESFSKGKISFNLIMSPQGIAQEILHILSYDSSYITGLLAGLGGV